ncbi:AMP-binding protein [Rhizorhabdus wittichii]|uniref:AMP-binding protein n=1 Tax=Rhizorhabdus wittichii TaxID=160791 RepID=A0A975D2E7_9SPHN|nr:ATP-dependent acyl-CoA ligase [Rhizorhabdus wittichii]QTH21697.1 AMP-binding protein [Rhizorhabdus wittichii]
MSQHRNPIVYFPAGRRSLPALIERCAERTAKAVLSCGGTAWTAQDCRDAAARFAGRLAEEGVRRGDRVAILCGNRVEFLQLFLGCAWLGAIAVPINAASRGPQIEHILRNSEPRLLAIEPSLLPALDGLAIDGLGLSHLLLIGEGEVGRTALEIEPLSPGSHALPPASVGAGDPLAILYTSGTTGPSKGVICPHEQFFWYGINCGIALGTHADDVLHTTLPLFHINALSSFVQALVYDARLVIEPQFSVSRYWAGVREADATIVSLLGAMVPMLLSRPESGEEQDHRVRIASGPGVPAALHAEFHRRTGIRLSDGYASTESNVAIISPRDDMRPGTMGVLLDGFEARVADADDQPVADGLPGELLLRAREPFAMAIGYHAMPDKTIEAWRNLWLHTGDRVIRDPDGYFYFVDRLKDTIRRRGENISSYEIEQVLLMHPAIAMAAAFPVSSELAEDEVMVALKLADGVAVTPEEIIAFCDGRMPYFSIPRFIDFVEDLPRTDNGKVQKFKLRERGVGPNSWDRDKAGIVVARR